MKICRTCAVEYGEPLPEVCPICADERQWVPADGQLWTSLDELAAAGQRLSRKELEPHLLGLTTDPSVGIGQQSKLVTTPSGSLLWDPAGYVDDDTAAEVLARGPVLAIASSHPHMFGVQVEWSRRLGDPPVLVCDADREWLGRQDSCIQFWSKSFSVNDQLTLHQVGGHFVGSAVAVWSAGAAGRGVLLSGDTVFPNPDRTSLGFLRSYPNKIPLSWRVVERIADQLGHLVFDRIYGNFDNRIAADAQAVLRFSADRHIGWARGDFDDLT